MEIYVPPEVNVDRCVLDVAHVKYDGLRILRAHCLGGGTRKDAAEQEQRRHADRPDFHFRNHPRFCGSR